MSTQPHSFLVVEHSRNNLFAVEGAFHGLPARVILCRNVGEATSYLQGAGIYADREKHPFPIAIISDLYPGPNPVLELLHWVRYNHSTAHVPFFIISDLIPTLHRDKAESFENTFVFQKPSIAEELTSLITTIVGRVIGQLSHGQTASGVKSPHLVAVFAGPASIA